MRKTVKQLVLVLSLVVAGFIANADVVIKGINDDYVTIPDETTVHTFSDGSKATVDSKGIVRRRDKSGNVTYDSSKGGTQSSVGPSSSSSSSSSSGSSGE